MPATGWEWKQLLDGSGSVRHNSTRLPAAALKGAVSPRTTAAGTPSAVDTVRAQFLSELDTNRAAILLVSSAPLNSFSRNRARPGLEFSGRGGALGKGGGLGLGPWE